MSAFPLYPIAMSLAEMQFCDYQGTREQPGWLGIFGCINTTVSAFSSSLWMCRFAHFDRQSTLGLLWYVYRNSCSPFMNADFKLLIVLHHVSRL